MSWTHGGLVLECGGPVAQHVTVVGLYAVRSGKMLARLRIELIRLSSIIKFITEEFSTPPEHSRATAWRA